MALDINIPTPGEATDAAAAAKPKKTPQFDISAAPSIDLDALLAKVQQAKPDASGKGRAPSALAGKLAESVLALVTKAKEAGIPKLPLGPVVKQIAVALGVDESKKSQYFYTLSQGVLKAIQDKVTLEKEGRSVFLVCAGEAPKTDPA